MRRSRYVLALCLFGNGLAAFAVSPAHAQDITGPSPSSTYQQPFLKPPPPRPQPSAVKPLGFELESEIPLPGPLPGYTPQLIDDRIEVPVAGGLAVTGWSAEAVPEILARSVPQPPAIDAEEIWVVGPRGKKRYRSLRAGFLQSQTRCRGCAEGWRSKWKARVGGAIVVPPLVTHHRIYVGALDDRVYAIQRHGGHRLWDVDVGGRVNRPLVRMTVDDPALLSDAEQARRLAVSRKLAGEKQTEKKRRKDSEVALLLCVPGAGRELLVLDAVTGTTLATFKLPNAEEKLIGSPVITPDGRIVVARQKYSPESADLMVFRLIEASGS